jgi:hypothetical protein
MFDLVKIPSCLWPAATKFPLVLSTETLTLIPDRVLLQYGGRRPEVRILLSLLGSVMLPLHSLTLENHSLFVLLCPYGDEGAEEKSSPPPSSISVCF